MFNSIVVAFDGSAHASRALEIGAEIAGRDNSSLAIVYVVDSSNMHIPEDVRKMGEIENVIDPMPRMLINFENAPASMMSSMAQANADSQAAMFQYADFLVDHAQESAREAGASTVESKVVLGDPAEEIVAYARDRKADLIITGSRGLGKLKSFVLGSTSNKVTQLADCSCLTVK